MASRGIRESRLRPHFRGKAHLYEDTPKSILDHLEDLRHVLIVSLSAWGIATILAFIFNRFFVSILVHPLDAVLRGTHAIIQHPIFTSPTEGFSVPFEIAIGVGLALSFPIISYQVWAFVAPGLRPVERRFAIPFLISSMLLFCVGAAFAYFVMPIGLRWLVTFLGGTASYLPDINSYLTFFLVLIVAFGLTFELPVVIVLLGGLGVVSSRQLRTKRKEIWVGIIILALLVTPGSDLFTPTLLALPLLALFEASVVVLDTLMHK